MNQQIDKDFQDWLEREQQAMYLKEWEKKPAGCTKWLLVITIANILFTLSLVS